MPYIEHPLGSTYYVKNKATKKVPLIIMHGGPGVNHIFLSPLLKQVQDRQLIMYDQLGTGMSSKTNKDKWNIKTFVEEFSYVADHFDFKEFHLMGASWGTTLALEYYLRKKDKRIKSLIFQSPMFSAELWHKDAKKLIKKLSPKHQAAIYHCEKVGAYDSKVYKDAEAAYSKKFVCRKEIAGSPIERGFKYLNMDMYKYMWGSTEFCPTGTLKNYDRVRDLKKIKIPSFIFCGENDESTPATNKIFQENIPNCELKVMKSLSHLGSFENPKLYVKTLQSFLNNWDS